MKHLSKHTKLILGFTLLGVAGYLYWKDSQPKKVTNYTGADLLTGMPSAVGRRQG